MWVVNGVRYPQTGRLLDTNESTYSFRSEGSSLLYRTELLTGLEMRQLLAKGYDISLDGRGGASRGEKIRRDGILDNTFDQGHEFWSEKRWVSIPNISFKNPTASYEGPFWSLGATGNHWHPDASSLRDGTTRNRLIAYGNKAIAQSAPTAPEAGLAQLIGELGQLPSLPGLALFKNRSARSVGGEYLNVEFGIKPMIRDIQSLARSVLESKKILEQYKRDAEKVVRRRVTLVDEEVKRDFVASQSISSGIGGMTLNGQSYSMATFSVVPPTRAPALLERKESVWFSGAFSYHLMETDTLLGKLAAYEQLANKLLGTRLDVSVVWELTPWSWLIDWFIDISSFLGRVNRLANDNLVLRYGYVMHEVHLEMSILRPGFTNRQGLVVPAGITTTHVHHKNRVRSTPYGFGFDVEALTPSRWAILAALGLTKAPGSLRAP